MCLGVPFFAKQTDQSQNLGSIPKPGINPKTWDQSQNLGSIPKPGINPKTWDQSQNLWSDKN
ncbi:hypothetical protein LPBF_07950 [Flavobacterium crassostreae]|uniref:Uncharacterized protein n=1 Tax=Flavobacterium crassostreae TaxID=1763534 RepID=A0A1B9E061_9FLAO|nr:hypothetical protein LPBF_07950 [Flavobacterium crassostreae]